jgi:hypothetical protein
MDVDVGSNVIALQPAFCDAAAGRRGWAGIGNTAFSRYLQSGVVSTSNLLELGLGLSVDSTCSHS